MNKSTIIVIALICVLVLSYKTDKFHGLDKDLIALETYLYDAKYVKLDNNVLKVELLNARSRLELKYYEDEVKKYKKSVHSDRNQLKKGESYYTKSVKKVYQ